jgi:hypothetical protein
MTTILAVDVALLLQSGVVAAVVAGVVSLAATVAAGRRARLDRQRQLFATAFEACASYKEFPFIVRRRSERDPGERARITAELAAVQRQLSTSLALIQVEAPKVAEKYETLVRQLREVAGGEIRRSWELPPIPANAAQSIEGIDLSTLDPYEKAYLEQVRKHLRLLPG